MMKILCGLALTVWILSGCASQRLSDTEKAELVEQYIVSEQLQNRSTVTTFNLDSWTAISDRYLILRTSPFKPYLIKLSSRCQDLQFSPVLMIDSRIPSSLSEGFDSVYTPDNRTFKCYISRIYPLTKEQNKALLAALNPSDEDKPVEQDKAQQPDVQVNSPAPSDA